MKVEDYDILIMVPPDKKIVDDSVVFCVHDESDNDPEARQYLDKSDIGYTWTTIVMDVDDSGKVINQDIFEAIFLDPYVYMTKSLSKLNRYAMMVKKSVKSVKELDTYVEGMLNFIPVGKK